ncbi:hypothetical protein RISK_005658 [Rhodopirellula islandica]|uniref:Uncharacterized protein n=1 Tax=Rhodopirellula islandica TaxID=595434 RepID=A0A0J1B778_RHOIS|nr:hypothetical protein RISK_005658 [Rhodopirellula islandica]
MNHAPKLTDRAEAAERPPVERVGNHSITDTRRDWRNGSRLNCLGFSWKRRASWSISPISLRQQRSRFLAESL